MKRRRARRWSVEEKAEILRRFGPSGLTQERFSEEIGISPTTLNRWLRDAKEGRIAVESPAVVPVRVVPSRSSGTQTPLEIVLTNNRRIRVSGGVDEQDLLRIIKVLEAC